MRRMGLMVAVIALTAGAAGAQTTSDSAAAVVKPLPGPAGAAQPQLLTIEASRDDIVHWLSVNIPSSKGRQVYVSGGEAFWIEHIDKDPKNAMVLVATIHTEYFADLTNDIRSVYQLTQFDCQKQAEYTHYARSYLGTGLTGEARNDAPFVRMTTFISPISADFPHIRAVCKPIYDSLHKNTYSLTVPE